MTKAGEDFAKLLGRLLAQAWVHQHATEAARILDQTAADIRLAQSTRATCLYDKRNRWRRLEVFKGKKLILYVKDRDEARKVFDKLEVLGIRVTTQRG